MVRRWGFILSKAGNHWKTPGSRGSLVRPRLTPAPVQRKEHSSGEGAVPFQVPDDGGRAGGPTEGRRGSGRERDARAEAELGCQSKRVTRGGGSGPRRAEDEQYFCNRHFCYFEMLQDEHVGRWKLLARSSENVVISTSANEVFGGCREKTARHSTAPGTQRRRRGQQGGLDRVAGEGGGQGRPKNVCPCLRCCGFEKGGLWLWPRVGHWWPDGAFRGSGTDKSSVCGDGGVHVHDGYPDGYSELPLRREQGEGAAPARHVPCGLGPLPQLPPRTPQPVQDSVRRKTEERGHQIQMSSGDALLGDGREVG